MGLAVPVNVQYSRGSAPGPEPLPEAPPPEATSLGSRVSTPDFWRHEHSGCSRHVPVSQMRRQRFRESKFTLLGRAREQGSEPRLKWLQSRNLLPRRLRPLSEDKLGPG